MPVTIRFSTRGFVLMALAALGMLLTSLPAAAQSEYRVRPGDTLVIEVLEDASLNRSVAVLPDGRFSFPFAGSIRAGGRTVSEIQSDLTSAITSNFVAAPNVFVAVQPAEREVLPTAALGDTIDVYFVGEVNNPGLVAVKPGTTLLQAVAISGGVSRFAAIKRVQLRRTNPATGVQNVTILNYKALSNGAVTTDIELKDGDVILVPERRLFE